MSNTCITLLFLLLFFFFLSFFFHGFVNSLKYSESHIFFWVVNLTQISLSFHYGMTFISYKFRRSVGEDNSKTNNMRVKYRVSLY